MATVITSLATVIPVVGKTVLSYLWGGYYKASRQKTLLDAGTGFLELEQKFQYVCDYFMNITGNAPTSDCRIFSLDRLSRQACLGLSHFFFRKNA